MTAAITAAGVAVVGGAIVANQSRQAAKGAANAQKDAANAATQVERERLQLEAQKYQQQMQEYQRRQAMNEKQMQQTIVNLAPYMQAGQGALYEMMALTGMQAPAGATMPTGPQPITAGMRAGGGFGTLAGGGTPGQVGLMGGITAPSALQQVTQGAASPAAAEFQKGGRSLTSKAWQGVSPTASPRAAAANALQQVRTELPNATPQEQQDEAIRRLNVGAGTVNQQALIDEARAQVPTVEAATSPYAGITGAEAQAAALDRISSSPLLQELMAQGETGILQNAAATGGLRGGRTQAALAQFRPQMLQQEIDKQYSRLQGLSGLGQQSILSAPTTAMGAAPNMSYANNIGGYLTQGGQAQAGGILGQAQANQNLFGDIAKTVGWGLEKYAGNTGFGGYGGGIGGATSTTPTSYGNAALDFG
jgi:hypothetical protein